MLMNIELDDLWVWHIATNRLRPILDPLTINVRIMNNDNEGDNLRENDRFMNIEINMSSNLRRSMIMFFRHQHILIILMSVIVLVMIKHKLFLNFQKALAYPLKN